MKGTGCYRSFPQFSEPVPIFYRELLSFFQDKESDKPAIKRLGNRTDKLLMAKIHKKSRNVSKMPFQYLS